MLRRSIVSMTVVLCATIACARFSTTDEVAPVPEIHAARTVYVADLGRSADAELTRDMLRIALTREAHFVVVDDARSADVILRGEVVLRRNTGRLQDARVAGALRLMARRSGNLLWQHRYEEVSMQTPIDLPTPADLLNRFTAQMSEDLHRAAIVQTARR